MIKAQGLFSIKTTMKKRKSFFTIIFTFISAISFLLMTSSNVHGMMESQTALSPAELFHLAIKEGEVDTVKKLLEGGFNPNQAFEDGITPLHMSVIHNQDQIAFLLIQNGANVKSKEASTEATPLHFAALYGRANIAKLLLEKGAEVNDQMRFGITPLLVAAQFKQPQLIELLLKHKADIRHTDQEGYTALHLSAQNNDEASAVMLINQGAEVNAKDKTQSTPLKIARTRNHMGMITLLKEHGALEPE